MRVRAGTPQESMTAALQASIPQSLSSTSHRFTCFTSIAPTVRGGPPATRPVGGPAIETDARVGQQSHLQQSTQSYLRGRHPRVFELLSSKRIPSHNPAARVLLEHEIEKQRSTMSSASLSHHRSQSEEGRRVTSPARVQPTTTSGGIVFQSRRFVGTARHELPAPAQPASVAPFHLFSTTIGPRAPAGPPGACEPFFRRDVCSCRAALVWAPAAVHTRCHQCQLSWVIQSWCLRPPPVSSIPCGDSRTIMIHKSLQSHMALSVNDFRWSTVQQHPTSAEQVVVVRSGVVVALVPATVARFMRSHIISSLSPIIPVNENDVAAHMIAWLSDASASFKSPPLVFVGDTHVFPPSDYLVEPGYLRQALLAPSSGPQHFAAPSQSAFFNIESFGSVLSADAYDTVRHPYAAFFAQGIRYGFPLLASTPLTSVYARNYNTPFSTGPLMDAAVEAIFANGAFIDASAWPRSIPQRHAPGFGVAKDGGTKVRFVGDFSAGLESVNAYTRRGGHPRARLGSAKIVIRRILHLMKTCPGERVMISKFDVSNAFRQCPLPARDFHKVMHRIGKRIVAEVRLPMGAVASGDSMSVGIIIVEDIASAVYDICVVSYIDDQCVVAIESRIEADIAIVTALWQFFNWPRNEGKFLIDGKPSTDQVVLGFHIDTVACTVGMPHERVVKVMTEMRDLLAMTVPDATRLRSLAGRLQFMSSVIPCGKAFIKSFYLAGYLKSVDDHLIDTVRQDLRWWLQALTMFNGTVSFIPSSPSTLVVYASCDASKFGVGGFCPTLNQCFRGVWDAEERRHSSISHREGGGIVFTSASWAAAASGGYLVIYTDNTSARDSLTTLRGKTKRMYLLMRVFALIQIHFRCRIVLFHIPGVHNVIADKLSRAGSLPEWISSIPQLQLSPTTRSLGGLLALPQPQLPRWDLATTAKDCGFGLDTAANDTMTSHTLLQWIPWKVGTPETDWLRADYGIFSGGSCGVQASSKRQLCATTSVMSVPSTTVSRVGSSNIHQTSPNSSSVGDSCRSNDSFESLPPSVSSSASSTTQLSMWRSGPPLSLRSTPCYDVPSTVLNQDQSSIAHSRFNGVTSTSNAIESACSSASPKPIMPTQDSGSGCHRRRTRCRVQQRGSGDTWRQPAILQLTDWISHSLSRATAVSSQGTTSRRPSSDTQQQKGCLLIDHRPTLSASAAFSKCATTVSPTRQSRLLRVGQRHLLRQ